MTIKVHERLIAMMAVEKGLISEKQLTECLNVQDFHDDRSIIKILLDRDYVTSSQVEKLREIHDRGIQGESQEINTSNAKFGILALKLFKVSHEELHESLEELECLTEAGIRVPLGIIMISRGSLDASQVKRILLEQGKNYLRCPKCENAFTVTGFHPDEFYHCKKCDAHLEEAEPARVKRSSIENLLARARRKEPWEEIDQDSGDLFVLDL